MLFFFKFYSSKNTETVQSY